MSWDDDLTMKSVPEERRGMQLAVYASYLATGNTLNFQSIKSSSIEQYLLAVAGFLAKFLGTDPRKPDPTSDHMDPHITGVLKQIKKINVLIKCLYFLQHDVFYANLFQSSAVII